MEILKSKKFQAALAGVIVALAADQSLDLDTEQILLILSPILTYIAGQGLADIGKERAKIEMTDGDSND